MTTGPDRKLASVDPEGPILETRSSYGESIVRLSNLQEYDRRRRRRTRREAVDSIFSEGFMIFLSLLLIPVLVVPYFVELPIQIAVSLDILDYFIILFFILEYFLKLYLAPDRREFVTEPWRLLDLFIIAATVMVLLSGLFPQGGGFLFILRALRLPVALSLGGRTIKRGRRLQGELPPLSESVPPRVTELDLDAPETGWRELPGLDLASAGGEGIWINITNATDAELVRFGRRSRMPILTIESGFRDWAYPRAEMSDGNAAFFLRLPDVRRDENDPSVNLVKWRGVLLLDLEKELITISRREVAQIAEVPQTASRTGLELRASTVLYLLMDGALTVVEEFILASELELSRLETIPLNRQPQSFLAVTYAAKREASLTVAWLVHARAVLQGVIDGRVSLRGWIGDDVERTKALLERCEYLLETAEDVNEGLADAIAFYLNNTSYQMNRVMKVIAVLTALAIIPAVVGGLLGMNLVGAPWPVSIAQTVTIVALAMLSTAWVYYRIGWLR